MTTPSPDDVVRLTSAGAELAAQVDLPEGARGLVVFAHGVGGTAGQPRNRFVASQLREGGLGTVLVDLLTRGERAREGSSLTLRFDVDLLARRVAGVLEWLDQQPATSALPLGLYGVSTGAAAVLAAAVASGPRVRAVVTRSGRPDLAGERLEQVTAPVLMLVGELDAGVRDLNEQAALRMRGPVQVQVVPRAGHLFDEAGTLQRAAALARDWYERHLTAP